jgi:hypothetical protein
MEKIPNKEDYSLSAGQDFPHPEVNYCVHKSPLLFSILSQMNSVHTIISYFFKVRFNIIPHHD